MNPERSPTPGQRWSTQGAPPLGSVPTITAICALGPTEPWLLRSQKHLKKDLSREGGGYLTDLNTEGGVPTKLEYRGVPNKFEKGGGGT